MKKSNQTILDSEGIELIVMSTNIPKRWTETKDERDKRMSEGRKWLQVSVNKFNKVGEY